MADRYFAVGHCHAMLHCNVMQGLVPGQIGQLMALSELISEVEGADTPLLGLTPSCALCIIVSSCSLVDYTLRVLDSHLHGGSCSSLGSGLDQLGSVVD